MRLRLLPTLIILLVVIILSAFLFSIFRKKPARAESLQPLPRPAISAIYQG
ncbi:MAG: hypothetical protein KC422_09685 [Trueperaceae bacterium]|nr:hypothetical protein [Trueperaceae bacterium]